MRHAESRFANSTRRAVAASVLALLSCASLVLGASPASADVTHGPVNFQFGQNGKPTSTFGTVNSIAYDQANERLYVLGHEALNGFSNPSPGVLTTLPPPKPILEQNSSDL